MLIGGEPGIGKSTLLVQAANEVARTIGPVLVVSGEESTKQVGLRARRLGTLSQNLFVLAEVNIAEVVKRVEEMSPVLLVVDSIQTMFDEDVSSAPGSVSQVRETTGRLMRLAKATATPVFIVGHVTKDGSIAGPRLLEHMVDTVLYFEGDRHYSFRVVRAVKNRYGSTNEIGVFEMTDRGLIEVSDPSSVFLDQRRESAIGSIAFPSIEGTRPIVVELQALVAASHLAVPRRLTSGLDYNRLCLTLAVLERRAGLDLGKEDVYVNAVGGAKVAEPAADLAVALAVASAHRDIPISRNVVAVGEIGLTGEVRAVSQLDARLKEAAKLGFESAIVPDAPRGSIDAFGLELLPAKTLQRALSYL